MYGGHKRDRAPERSGKVQPERRVAQKVNEVRPLVPDETCELVQEPRIGERAVPWPVQKVQIDSRIEPGSKVCVAPARNSKDDLQVLRNAAGEGDGVVFQFGNQQ